ncbi:5'/3'-nucleotidase SurE [Sphingomonas xinjiangensis]|uniref:5'-nucleotidase SurE n=1 Tax=Sphingomonas xinjiangensis TaxID=643568 RepID=A0A840YNF8_9SPHN|nr:5'/3'-nucleotidase SurE [Sphingomonas xinjiangensis]MBB5709002.1 5'-nucleotidase [Sphingomonas xinjiangensis]
MRILLTNDDGYHARGLAHLETLARTISDDITVIAPADEQSGKGRSLSLTEPFRVRRHGDNRYAVHGTPTDCVMFALADAMKDNKPDLILSGINRGGNLAEDVSYSGTVSAAMEGALAGIRSVALSQRYARGGAGEKVPFDAAMAWGERALRPLLAMEWAPRTLVNINFPPLAPEAVKGIKVVSQGLRDYGRVGVEKRADPRGFDYYWLAMGSRPIVPAPDTDLEAIEQGYVTVTPLQLDLTHRDSLDALKSVYS